jgi:hypothetical protein
MKEQGKVAVGRRRFLVSAGVAAAASVAVPALTVEAQADSESNNEKRKPRYRVTDHVKAYYRVNRYPASK